MAKLEAPPPPDALLRELLTETDESAAAALFVQLCQHSAPLRHWLWEDFVRDAKVRDRFAARLRGKSSAGVARLAELGDETQPWREEVASLRQRFPGRIYGGLTWREVETLIGQFRAGRADLAAFLLALQWRRAGKAAAHSPHLLRASAAFLQDVLSTGSATRLTQLATAMRLVNSTSPSQRRASVGFSDWWKLQCLLFMLRNPRESYRTRDLQAHLATLGLIVSSKEIRRFCSRCGIRRDMRAGRPPGRRQTRIRSSKHPGTPASPKAGRATASELHRP